MSAYQLRRHADQLDTLAKESRRLADELAGLPNPVGNAILSVAAMLARHGLCVIHREALQTAERYMQQVEFSEDPDHYESGAGYNASLAAVQAALQQTTTAPALPLN